MSDQTTNQKPTIRDYVACWLKERLRTEFILRPWLSARFGFTWRDVCNRIDDLQSGPDGVSRFVNSRDSSYLRVAELFPEVGRRILQLAATGYPFCLQSSAAVIGRESPDLSVIIPFAGVDRLKQLQAVLDSFDAQSQAKLEVILVQGGTATETELHLEPGVRTIQMDEPPGSRFNKSRLFNAGVRVATAPYLLLHDADILVPQNYVSTCVGVFQQGWDAFCPIRFLFYLSQAQTADFIRDTCVSSLSTRQPEIRQNFAGGSVAITRKAFDQIGGFDETFEGWGGEDVEFLHRARKTKFFVGNLAPALHLWHPPAIGKSQQHANLKLASIRIMETRAEQTVMTTSTSQMIANE